MPSDDRVTQILKALAGSREGFHSAVVAAVEEIGGWLASHRAPANDRRAQAAAELGAFGAERIDPDRFAALLADDGPVDEKTATLLERSQAVLRELLRAGDALYHVDVPPGRDLAAAVDAALATVGKAFGAARVAELARSGRSAAAGKDDPSAAWPFARWNRPEREIAPPLVVEVDGGDLVAGGLAAFLDGRQKLVLVVRGPAPPAALARLITPGVFVMQASDPADLARFTAFEGPAIAAVVPEGSALFTHEPAPGARVSVTSMPDGAPRKAVGRLSGFVQTEELKLLGLLAAGVGAGALAGEGAGAGTVTTVAAGAATGAAAAAPADVLAAWLLRQANLTDVGA